MCCLFKFYQARVLPQLGLFILKNFAQNLQIKYTMAGNFNTLLKLLNLFNRPRKTEFFAFDNFNN